MQYSVLCGQPSNSCSIPIKVISLACERRVQLTDLGHVLFSQEAPCAIHKELTTLILTMTVLSEDLWKGKKPLHKLRLREVGLLSSLFFLPLFSNADVISKHLQQQLLGETRHLLPSPFQQHTQHFPAPSRQSGPFFHQLAITSRALRCPTSSEEWSLQETTLEELLFLSVFTTHSEARISEH